MKFTIVSLILVTLVLENLVVVVVCKRTNGFGDGDGIIGNYDDVDETSKILNELKEDIDKAENDNKRKINNKNKINFNDDVSSLEEDAAKATEAIGKQQVTPSSKLPQASASGPSAPASSSTTFINNHEDDASHSWTIFFILCILGKYDF